MYTLINKILYNSSNVTGLVLQIKVYILDSNYLAMLRNIWLQGMRVIYHQEAIVHTCMIYSIAYRNMTNTVHYILLVIYHLQISLLSLKWVVLD